MISKDFVDMNNIFFVFSIFGMIVWSLFCGFWEWGVLNKSYSMYSDQSASDVFHSAGITIGTMISGGFVAYIWFIVFVALGIVALISKPSNEELIEELKNFRKSTTV